MNDNQTVTIELYELMSLIKAKTILELIETRVYDNAFLTKDNRMLSTADVLDLLKAYSEGRYRMTLRDLMDEKEKERETK